MNALLPRPFGRYTLLEKIGAGGAGAAYLAISDRDPLRAAVVKCLHARLAQDRVSAARLRHEAAIAVSVESPHVVRVLDVGVVNEELFIAMDRVPGVTVARTLTALSDTEESLSIGTVIALLLDGLSGLASLHDAVHPETREPLAVVHRDVTPRNLMITPDMRLVLIDLGLGKSNLRDWATTAGAVIGTPGYIAPEHARGGAVDRRADLYSLAVVGFEMLTQHLYLERQEVPMMLAQCIRGAYRPPSSLRAEVPEALDRFFERALSTSPEARFGSAEEMANALRSIGAIEERAQPPVLGREVEKLEQRVAGIVSRATLIDPPPDEPTVIWAERSVTIKQEPPSITVPLALAPTAIVTSPKIPVSRAQPTQPKRWTAIAAGIGLGAIAAGAIIAYRVAMIDETVVLMNVPPAPVIEEVKVEPVPATPGKTAIEEPTAPPAIEATPERAKPVKAARPQPRSAPVETSIESAPQDAEPDFEALAKSASALKSKRPELGRELDALITDATMWRQSDPTPESAKAWRRLKNELDRLDARARP